MKKIAFFCFLVFFTSQTNLKTIPLPDRGKVNTLILINHNLSCPELYTEKNDIKLFYDTFKDRKLENFALEKNTLKVNISLRQLFMYKGHRKAKQKKSYFLARRIKKIMCCYY